MDEYEAKLKSASKYLGRTPHGFFLGDVFVPRAWTVDKCEADKLDPWLRWNFVYSRCIIVMVPLLSLMASFIVASNVGGECRYDTPREADGRKSPVLYLIHNHYYMF